MATYTVVDEGYEVQVFKNLDALCDEIRGSVYADGDLYIGHERNGLKATVSNVKKYLRNSGNCVMWLHRDGEDDWALKVQRHK